MSHVARQVLERSGAACVAVFLSNLIETAKLEPGAPTGRFRVHSSANVQVDLPFQVQMKLSVEFTFDGCAPEQSAEPEYEVRQHQRLG
jgi:hypothetical protein